MLKNPKYVYGSDATRIPKDVNFGVFILNKLRSYNKNEVAMINTETHETLTYHQILEGAVSAAISLIRIGVTPGDLIALCSENRFEYVCVLIGGICAGAVITPINISYTKSELTHIMNISKPKFMFCSHQVFEKHENTFKTLNCLKKVIVFGDAYRALCGRSNRDSGAGDASRFEARDVRGQSDVLLVLYSSGTTGLPKGVMLTHLNVIAFCSVYDPVLDSGPSALNFNITPWFHAMGLMTCITSLARRNKLLFMSKFNIETYLESIERYKVTQLTVVPHLLLALCKSDCNTDFRSIRIIYCGAAPLHKDVFQQVRQRFPNVKGILQGYGMTEATLAVTKDTNDVEDSKPGGVGYCMPDMIIKVKDVETQKPLGPNEPGEICVKGQTIMKGYIGIDHQEVFDEEGFFRTGDVGYYDDDKYFFIVDRLKEIIKYKGFQVPPAEIEAILMQHDAVKEAGVVGIPDAVGGEVPLAFVVVKEGKTVTEGELKKLVADKLSNPKQLRGGVQFIQEIPKNQSGKILRRVLRNMIKNNVNKSKL